jgi:hypothetical protein
MQRPVGCLMLHLPQLHHSHAVNTAPRAMHTRTDVEVLAPAQGQALQQGQCMSQDPTGSRKHPGIS